MTPEELAEWRKQDAANREQRRQDAAEAKKAKATSWQEDHRKELEAARERKAADKLAGDSEPKYERLTHELAAVNGISLAEQQAIRDRAKASYQETVRKLAGKSIAEQTAAAPSVNPIGDQKRAVRLT